MVDVRGDVLRPPHGTTPAAVKSNIKSEMRSFKSNDKAVSAVNVVDCDENLVSHTPLQDWTDLVYV